MQVITKSEAYGAIESLAGSNGYAECISLDIRYPEGRNDIAAVFSQLWTGDDDGWKFIHIIWKDENEKLFVIPIFSDEDSGCNCTADMSVIVAGDFIAAMYWYGLDYHNVQPEAFHFVRIEMSSEGLRVS